MSLHKRRTCTGLRALARPAVLFALLVAPLATSSAATAPADDPVRASARDPHRLCIGDGRGEVTLQADGRQLSVIQRDGDHVTTTVVDMDQIGRLVGDAMGEAMAAVQDLQLQVRLGQDNRLNITTADSEVEVDLDQIMSQVAAAVQEGLRGIDTATWASRRAAGDGVVVRGDARDQVELRRELADLQDEMQALRKELRRLRDQAPPPPPPPARDR